ncbi:electron transport complex subunit RsxC [Lentisalinibacter sediminis]|uniref:electron transport complex subunit RsxC n=1 Tax=Lentisalinibacter sediminis TaxID=2992237 RepID=UPI00386DFD17
MTAPTEGLSRLHGGLRLPAQKARSTGAPIREVAVPPRLIMPLGRKPAAAARPLVAVGDRVARGQRIAEGLPPDSANVHAGSSGTVAAIEDRPVPARDGGTPVPCILIDTDGDDRLHPDCRPLPDSITRDPAALAGAVEAAGILGLGGAAYPTAPKLAEGLGQDLEALILNGAECEPYISCDDRLMREQAADIVAGARLMLTVIGIRKCIVAIESDKPEAWQAMKAAVAEAPEGIRLVQLPTVYPSGGEDQLVRLLTGREVPSGGLPTDVGYLVHNVGTAEAVARLATSGEPLVSRVVTVTGEGIAEPGNYRVRLGTPIADLARAAGSYTERAACLIMGGPMTGVSLPHDDFPVVGATNCLLFTREPPALAGEPERPCIRCGECARVCPVRLQPQHLHRHAAPADEQALALFGLDDCIECGCCDLVCPSHIPLTRSFREAKAALRLKAHERRKAERARHRFEAREQRLLEREQAARERQEDVRREAGAEAIREILKRRRGRSDDEG